MNPEFTAKSDPVKAFIHRLRQPHTVFLDSVCGGRLSLLAAEPELCFSCHGREIEIRWASGRVQTFSADPFEVLEDLLASKRPSATEPLRGAAIGYFGYGLKNYIEKLPARALDDLGLPDCWFGFYDAVTVFDNSPAVQSLPPQTDSCAPFTGSITANFTRPQYLAAVARAKEYIAAGDIYQVNLSQRFQTATNIAAPELYLALRQTNPAPFAAYLDLGNAQILSSSPESFLRIHDRQIRTRPIKGTRPRTGDQVRDAIAARDLLMSAKDQAELLMITDLLRNDLGKVCAFGTVRVPELTRLETYATVFHLVSTVDGFLRSEVSHVEAVRACFPGGSITGAPKIRAMEIIDELEPQARGIYTGAIGYFGFNGVTHFNIAIRTMLKHGGDVYFHAGGGIVADSDPAAEYDETLAKARGMMTALEQANIRKNRSTELLIE